MKRRHGFTLVELLVVIAIIGALVGLLMPAIQAARGSSRSAQGKSNLKQIGLAMTQYLDAQGQKGKFPQTARLPVSQNRDKLPSLFDVLAPFCESNREIFHCSGDYYDPGQDEDKTDETDTNFETWFEKEGLSYEYPSSLFAGKTRPELMEQASRGTSEIWIVWDFGPFHGPPAENGSRNFAYLDGHVDAVVVRE